MIVILTPGAVTGLRKDNSNHESTQMDTDESDGSLKAVLHDSRKTAALDPVLPEKNAKGTKNGNFSSADCGADKMKKRDGVAVALRSLRNSLPANFLGRPVL